LRKIKITSMNEPREQRESGTQDAMDWYSGGALKAPGYSGGHGMEPKPAAGLSLVLQKINLVTSLAALILFFLPWIDIQCSGKSLATQTGIQTIYGGGSPAQDMEAFEKEGRDRRTGRSNDKSMGSPLVALALLAVIGAVVAAFLAIRSAGESRSNLTGILCAVALALLALQMMIGFPVKKNLNEQVAGQSKTEQRAEGPLGGFGEGMAQAIMMQIQIRHLPALYIELILLGLPSLILANRWLDGLGKG
jgi:hypothetical protein